MLNELTENLIKGLKTSNILKDVRFIKAYKGDSGDSPVESPLVTVGEEDCEFTSFAGGYTGNGNTGERLSYNIILNIYCPFQSGGDGIARVVSAINDKLKFADVKNIVKSVKVTEIKYSKLYEALYRSMTITLDYIRKENVYGV